MSSVSVSKNDGVSPVIGTILLVALTAILVGIVGAVLMGFASPEPAPILGISIVQQGNITTITHLNGAVLPAGKFKILVDGVDKTAAFGGTGDFGPGMKLSWDSGAEKVGTVSIVYTGETGKSMLITDKKIGKTGRGGGGGGDGFEDKYTINTRKDWQLFLVEVNNGGFNSPLGTGIVYVDGGDYWVSYDGQNILKTDAATYPSIQEYMEKIPTQKLIKINLSNKIFTSADINGAAWHAGVVIKQGSLFEDDVGKLSIWLRSYSPLPSDKTNWLQIASRKV